MRNRVRLYIKLVGLLLTIDIFVGEQSSIDPNVSAYRNFPKMDDNTTQSTTQGIFYEMLENIQGGEWPVGSAIPSERTLIGQFGVSRIAIREAVSMLRGLGVVNVSHGRRTRVRELGVQVFDQLMPMMLASGGQRTFEQVFEMRLAIESSAASLAAANRTEEQLSELQELEIQFRDLANAASPEALDADLAFHLQIANATGNPLFSILIGSLARFVVFGQLESCKDDPVRRERAVLAHDAIVEAIAAKDSERARAEMETHLRYSASRVIEAMKDSEQ